MRSIVLRLSEGVQGDGPISVGRAVHAVAAALSRAGLCPAVGPCVIAVTVAGRRVELVARACGAGPSSAGARTAAEWERRRREREAEDLAYFRGEG